jgi:nucleoside phosphorylase
MPTSFCRGPFALVVGLAIACAGCSSDDRCDAQPGAAAPAAIAVLGAMPSELAPLVERATLDDTQVIDGHVFHLGTLGGERVVLAMTGIGLVNATETSRVLLDNFAVRGMIFSGVAGSPHRIADVTVPLVWALPDGEPLPVDDDWLAHARNVAASGDVSFERCTPYPLDDPAAELVCLAFEPAIFVSGRGESSDPYSGGSVVCRPGAGDVFGCDPDLPAASTAVAHASSATPALERTADDATDEVTVDMETAAVAREAAARGLPFIAFRAVSDGAEDPLGLPGFPSQFFAYYRLAAENAAIATAAFLEELSATEAADPPSCS